jgi:hypothetical protein
MSENQGRREPGQQKEDKGVSRRRFVAGAVVVGGLVLLAYLYRGKIKTIFVPRENGKTTTGTKTTEGTTTKTTETIETTKTTATTGTTATATTTTGTTATTGITTRTTVTATTSVTLTAPEMPSEMLRPYLTIRISGLTHGSGGSPDVLDIFLVNGGYGAATAFFDVYGWLAPSGTGTITRAASRSGKTRGVLAAESDIFPLSFPGSRCIFLTREMIALPPGAAIARSVSIDRSLMDGIWGILYDPMLDPARFTISSADYFATGDGQRKYIYCGV